MIQFAPKDTPYVILGAGGAAIGGGGWVLSQYSLVMGAIAATIGVAITVVSLVNVLANGRYARLEHEQRMRRLLDGEDA